MTEVTVPDLVPVSRTSDLAPDAPTPSQTAPVHVDTPASEPAKVSSMEDTIRTKFRELNKPAEAIRGPDGKFQKPADLAGKVVAPEPAAEPVAELEADPAAEPVVEPAVEPVAEPVDPALEKAPSSWTKEAQAKWAATDPVIRKEAIRREADFHKGLETYKGWARVGQELNAEIQPYEALIRAANTTPQALIKDVFNTIYQLKTGSPDQKAAVALNILNEYGVDLAAVQTASEKIAEGLPPVDPRVQHLETEVQRLTRENQEREQAALRSQFTEVVNEAEAFKKAAGHEHYEDVKLEMAAFIESGVCSTLQEAYDKAIWSNTQVRAKLEAERQKAERAKAAEKAAAAKKAASTNVVPRGTLPGAPKVGTMEDTIKTKLREINARA